MSNGSRIGWLVEAGVRRCVAAHRAGKVDILAEVVVAGELFQTVRVPLGELYGTKSSILRDRRQMVNTEYPTAVLGTEPPPIQVSPPYHGSRMKYLTAIPAVQLV